MVRLWRLLFPLLPVAGCAAGCPDRGGFVRPVRPRRCRSGVFRRADRRMDTRRKPERLSRGLHGFRSDDGRSFGGECLRRGRATHVLDDPSHGARRGGVSSDGLQVRQRRYDDSRLCRCRIGHRIFGCSPTSRDGWQHLSLPRQSRPGSGSDSCGRLRRQPRIHHRSHGP